MNAHGPPLLDREYAATIVLLALVTVVGLLTVRDYAITIDEFLFDDYGAKALAWYVGGSADWPQFLQEDVPYYGPWFQMLTAAAQSLGLADRFDVRHAVTFIVGIVGLAALVPLGRLFIGRWAGFAAVVLCLVTGNFYGHLFFSPNDVPFMAVMNWATLAIAVMARGGVPTWRATLAAGLLAGLAIATRPGGLIAQVYLVAAMALCAIEAALTGRRAAVLRIALRAAVAVAAGWILAAALWPWLQTSDPLGQFAFAFAHFADIGLDLTIRHWGREYSTLALPWFYVPGELAARLPEAFAVLLVIALVLAVLALARFLMRFVRHARRGDARLAAAQALLTLARSRALLLVFAAAFAPILFVMVKGSTLYDGIRHLLFTLPMLALLAAWALMHLWPLIARVPLPAAIAATAYVVALVVNMAMLHPLEYVATNAFAGGTSWSHGRFDLDYWCAAAKEALRRLEERLATAGPQAPSSPPPRLLICIPWREHMVQPMFRREFSVAKSVADADYVITTERSDCGIGADGIVIDEVKRFDRVFARVIARPRPPPG